MTRPNNDLEDWNKQKQLIEAVQKETCLYDAKHLNYLNITLKESIWKRIAQELSFKSGKEAKKAWEKLRNNHRDALRRQKQVKERSGTSVVKIKRWRFQDDMAFILPHMSHKTHSYTRGDMPEEERSPRAGRSGTRDDESIMIDDDSDTVNEDNNQSSGRSSTDTSTDQPPRKRQKKTANERNTSREERQQRSRDRQLPELEREPPANDFTVHNVKNDPLYHFFIGMYETTKSLPRRSQHDIKTKIFSLVTQEEYKELYSPQHSSNTIIGDAATDTLLIPGAVKQQPYEYLPDDSP